MAESDFVFTRILSKLSALSTGTSLCAACTILSPCLPAVYLLFPTNFSAIKIFSGTGLSLMPVIFRIFHATPFFIIRYVLLPKTISAPAGAYLPSSHIRRIPFSFLKRRRFAIIFPFCPPSISFNSSTFSIPYPLVFVFVKTSSPGCCFDISWIL